MSSDVSALKISDLCVDYGNNMVLDHIDLDVKQGEVFGLMGLNGAGKTTMIKCILGLREQDSGDIQIHGQNKRSKESQMRLSYLPEKFEPPWFLTGMEFLKFSMELYQQKFNEQDMLEAAQALSLDQKALTRRMNTYSKGMRQKLGLMGTLLTGGDLFVLDEPMSGLDPRARALVKKMINTMRHKDRTIFLSSHILADMDEICDRVALLHESKILYVGTSADLKLKYNAENLEQAFLDVIEGKKAA